MPTNTSATAPRKRSPKYRASVPVTIGMATLRGCEAAADALGERCQPVGDEGGRLDDEAAADDIKAGREDGGERDDLQPTHPGEIRPEHGGDKAGQPQQRH